MLTSCNSHNSPKCYLMITLLLWWLNKPDIQEWSHTMDNCPNLSILFLLFSFLGETSVWSLLWLRAHVYISMWVTSQHTCVAEPCTLSLVLGEPQLGGQRRRLTEAIPQLAVSIIGLWGQRLFRQVWPEWRGVNNSATPEEQHLLALCAAEQHLSLVFSWRCVVMLTVGA